MRSQSLSSQHQRIVQLISTVDGFGAEQIELQAHWARYLCVLSSGFLENALKELYGGYAKSCCPSTVANFVQVNLNNIQNPKSVKFLETAGAFSKEWRQGLEVFLGEDGNKDAIDSIISNRNLIAHGESSGITLARLKDYLKKSVKMIEFIENQCELA